MKRKYLAIILIILMLSLLLGSCTSPQNTTATTTEATTATTKEDLTNDPFAPFDSLVTISIGKGVDLANSNLPEGDTWENNVFSRYIEEKLNLKVTHAWEANGGDAYNQKVSVSIASSELPDAFKVNDVQLKLLVDSGLILDMTEIYQTTVMPEIKTVYDSYEGNGALKLCTFSDKLLALPGTGGTIGTYNFLYIRKDWLDKLALPLPKTLDDIINTAKAFIENDPGENGAGNTVGITLAANITGTLNSTHGFDTVFGLFNSYPKVWIKGADGKALYGTITPETKTALAKVREMYEQGVIDKEFATRKDANELILGNKAGMFFGAWWMGYWPLNSVITQNPVPDWTACVAPVGTDGKMNVYTQKPTNEYLVVSKACANPTAIVKLNNLEQDILGLGTGQFEDGYPIYEKAKADNIPWAMWPLALQIISADQLQIDHNSVKEQLALPKEQRDLTKVPINRRDWVDAYDAYVANPNKEPYPYTIHLSYNVEENYGHTNNLNPAFFGVTKTMETKWATLQKLEDEYIMKIIFGEYVVDDFDKFVSEWKRLGGDEITAEVNAQMN